MTKRGMSNLANDQRPVASAAPAGARPAPPASKASTAEPATADKCPSPLDATSKAIRNGLASRPSPSTYSLRIEYAPDASGDLPLREQDLLPNWSREFTVSGKATLEQLSGIILDILDWDSFHLYEFRIHNRVYAER
ncbi:MAG: plasmid pRiA4b ORF-3 family protein [Acidobacteria bacterium]|nr:plasmid pRiA4b ORF-3 family protein [Acidobacteriota bacterium]MCI0723840.1 plasmid pRiA4b ORF-3 family protein [Acidobacteriota bacterium]